MNRTPFFILVITLLSVLVCMAYAGDQRGGSALDQGGTYCAGATVIPSNETDYVDVGYLDGDNDCSAPFPWPYNDVFYTFTPSVTRTYIFRLQLSAPSTNVAMRIMANACCSGGTSLTGVQEMVSADCDTGRTTYLRAELVGGTQYWFHVGDNSSVSHDSRYRFEMMLVDCPPRDQTAMHHTCETAQGIAANDSIMGDSATFGHEDWYSFTLDINSIVTISEFGRSFGHCNSGFYPLCPDNPLNAHFYLYCECPDGAPADSVLLGEANGELCSTDAELTLCLPAGGPYYIKVQNYGGYSWLGWDYILRILSTPTTDNCPPLPTACFGGVNFCPGPIDTFVYLNPDLPVPGYQTAQVCAFLNPTVESTIIVDSVLLGPNRMPVVSIGGDTCTACIRTECRPLIFPPIFNPNAWVYDSLNHRWTNTIQPQAADTGCCICIRLERILPAELLGFTAVAGDEEVTLNWTTASENRNDHFEITRNGEAIAVIRGAGTSSSLHNYRYTDAGLINYVDYNYGLAAVDMNGARQNLGTLSTRPQAGPSVVTDYALYQNYPNPFNPSTQIGFDLVEAGSVSLKIYNLMGQEVAVLVNGNLTAGRHLVTFNAMNLPSGIYVYHLTANGFTAEKKMLLMK